ncbi:MAG TPA: endonuclease/exonuclease/phosphatase family protein [Candidatus Limnocylindria bacterium]|nr:endonuclease/exonuclease/phosphatase family protein [Candidatus Limnocylindria bacterium]
MIGEVTFGVIGLLLLFADLRTFSATFQQTFFGAPNTNLAVAAIAVFGTSFLALLVAARLGPRRAVGLSAVIFGIATLLLTASRSNWMDLALSVVALAAGLWWLGLFHSSRAGEGQPALARALPIAFVADLALRAAFRTQPVVDLAWPVAVGIVLVAVLVFGAAGLASLSRERQWTAPSAIGTLALIAAPALVLIAETGATNGAQVAVAAGLGLGPEPARATGIGQIVLGLGLAAGALALVRFGPNRFIGGAALAIGAALMWAHLPLLPLLGGAALAAGLVVASATILGAPQTPARSPTGGVLALSLGWLLFVGAAFGFYAFFALQPAVWAATAVVALATLVAPTATARLGAPLAAAVATVAVAVPLLAFLATPGTPEPEPPKVTFRLMTYNVHQGFNAGQIPSLDDIVATIAHESPDVLVLQEVVRGWMIDEQHDVLSVLAQRLEMYYTFLPTIGDLYGNAVLSKYPMEVTKRVSYAPGPTMRNQPRGALFVRIGDLLVVTTHLDHTSDGTFVRQDQVRTILREVGDATAVVVAGDLNADPGDIEIRLFDQAGYQDLGQSAGPTTTGDEPPKRIDYVWGIGVVGAQAHTTPENNLSSDHRGLVVNITRTGR